MTDEPIRCSADVYGKAKSFQQQMPALGASWILLGTLIAFIAGGILFQDDSLTELTIRFIQVVAALGGIWAVVGIAVCCRILSALRYGLILHYLLMLVLVAGFLAGAGQNIWLWLNAHGQLSSAYQLGVIIGLALHGLLIGLLGYVLSQAHRLLTWSRELQYFGISPTTRVEQLVETNWKENVDWQ